MTVPFWVIIVLSVATDFVITGGGTLLGAIIESGTKAMPSPVAMVVALLAGAVAAAKELRSLLHIQMPSEPPKPVEVKP